MKQANIQTSSADVVQEVVVKSDDGNVCFHLRLTRSGLWVLRDRWRKDTHARLVQSVVFASIEGFLRWCESDSVRFDYPLVFSALKREGRTLLQAHGGSSNAGRDFEAS